LDAIGQATLGLKLNGKKKQRQADDTAAKAHWQLVFRNTIKRLNFPPLITAQSSALVYWCAHKSH
jgi:hypothetical protein